jgi:predicted signal transduction protein with EAL and GGDEF domain
MLLESYKRFAEMVQSRTLLDEKQRQTEAARHAADVMAFTDALTGLPNRRYFRKTAA